MEQAIQHLNLREQEVFFWGVHAGAELDLVFQHKGKRWGVEAKYGDAPTFTSAMHAAMEELSLTHLWVIYPGDRPYRLSQRVSVVPVHRLRMLAL